jgi:predicted transcriptional regulator
MTTMLLNEKTLPYTSCEVKTVGPNGEKLMAWRRARGITRVTFAKIANCSERKMATYEKQEKLPAPVSRQTTEAVRLVNGLEGIIPVDELSGWLASPNPGFDDRTPLEVIDAGEADLLWDMIYQTRESAYA